MYLGFRNRFTLIYFDIFFNKNVCIFGICICELVNLEKFINI